MRKSWPGVERETHAAAAGVQTATRLIKSEFFAHKIQSKLLIRNLKSGSYKTRRTYPALKISNLCELSKMLKLSLKMTLIFSESKFESKLGVIEKGALSSFTAKSAVDDKIDKAALKLATTTASSTSTLHFWFYRLIGFLRITYFLERILIEHIK